MSTASGMFVQFVKSIIPVIHNIVAPSIITSLAPPPPPPLTHAPFPLLALTGWFLKTLDPLTASLVLPLLDPLLPSKTLTRTI